MTSLVLHDFSWQRMINAVEAVKERACRAAAALEQAGIPYAVAGGNAVAAWVARVDEDAVRNTNDVDILVRRSDFDAIKQALEGVGFEYHFVNGVECFIDGPDGKPSRGVHLLFANEKVRDSYPVPTADVTESVPAQNFFVVTLDALVRMKLNAYRDKDRTHLRDLLGIGLIDQSWCSRLCPQHAERLQQIIDTPDG